MSNTYFNLASGPLTQDWSNAGLITVTDNWSGVPSIQGRGHGHGVGLADPVLHVELLDCIVGASVEVARIEPRAFLDRILPPAPEPIRRR